MTNSHDNTILEAGAKLLSEVELSPEIPYADIKNDVSIWCIVKQLESGSFGLFVKIYSLQRPDLDWSQTHISLENEYGELLVKANLNKDGQLFEECAPFVYGACDLSATASQSIKANLIDFTEILASRNKRNTQQQNAEALSDRYAASSDELSPVSSYNQDDYFTIENLHDTLIGTYNIITHLLTIWSDDESYHGHTVVISIYQPDQNEAFNLLFSQQATLLDDGSGPTATFDLSEALTNHTGSSLKITCELIDSKDA